MRIAMRYFVDRLWWLSVPVLAFAIIAAVLSGNSAIAIVAAALLGIVLATPRYHFLLATMLIAPLTLLALILLVVGTSWGISSSPLGDAAAAVPLGVLAGGSAVCSLIPYAAARWSRRGLSAALLTWICGTIAIAAAASFATSALERRLPNAPLLGPERAKQVRAMNASMWVTFSNGAVYFQYDGQVDLPACNGVRSHVHTMQISPEARGRVAQFVDGPFAEKLKRWFDGSYDGDPRIPCQTSVDTTAAGITKVTRRCEPTARMKTFTEQNPMQGFDIKLPTVHFQARPLDPGASSMMTITAPRGCIADTFPRAQSREEQGATETLRLRVGFPRQNFALQEAERLGAEPWNVHVYLVKPALRGRLAGAVARTLIDPWSLPILFLAVVLASRSLTVKAGRAIAQGERFTALTSRLCNRLSPARDKLTRLRHLYGRRGRLVRLLSSGAIVLVGLPIVLILLNGLSVLMMEPTFVVAAILVLVALVAIEAIAFLVRRLPKPPAEPPPLPGSSGA
ncbi:hypothetical protein CO669_17310 [Bradyrhizobium sp. Y36]|uniref:hypothetical protein n=1 Tax=Bradyrhizobium sp. Y36 TaxID=2035447 RepID=UPI000BE89630|nr:hypothetical protein [Bradyrhizobium sp. Y36]PDT88893.1 hypothetical protein CO669_17310 [Bradyrhizobium sp. Y36]